ncbi:PREDICTED: LOW QUALITY PROTEIN: uncharacterized protein LOC105535187 [Mandrillus leucophaeus]|uniref:LOW QUALITY PROTEIN: uncharacterized protein LOC105535187 n=1 Tax=Mandrillus leucophaeus TaxID=9568 RepID=UPI0005F40051|nr:PREDICTED: LOW QUALITY PROTEIN: uncharacterized protein LOC105535187 [Mandrillus leucophaeus]
MAFLGPLRPLLAASPGPAFLPSCFYRPNSCLTATSLDSAPAQLLAAFVGPKLPQAKLSRPSSDLTVASPGSSAPTLQWSLQTPKLPPGDSSRPSLGLLVDSVGPHIILKLASPGPALAFQWTLQVQQGALSGPLQGQLLSLARLPPHNKQPLCAQLLPASWQPLSTQTILQPELCRPTFCLPVACTDAALSGEQPLRAPHLPPRGISRPTSHLMVASRGQIPACLPPSSLDMPSFSHTVACFGPTHASRGPPRGVSSCLTLASLGRVSPSRRPIVAQLMPLVASLGPAPACEWPLQAQPLPHSGTSLGPPLASPWPMQAKLLPFGGLCRPSFCLPVASIGQAHASMVAFPGLEFPALHHLQALHFLQLASPGPTLPPGGLCRSKLPSSWPLRARLFLLATSAGPGCPQVGLPLPSSRLSAASPGPERDLQSASPGPAPCLHKAIIQAQPLPHSGLSDAQASASLQPLQCEVPAFRQLQQAPLMPPNGLLRLSSPLPAAFTGPGCPLLVACPGPALHPDCVYRPSSCLTATCLDSAPAHLLAAFVGPKLPQAKLSRPSSGLMVASQGGSAPAHIVLKSASPGPVSASRQPLQARLSPHSGFLGPCTCLPAFQQPQEAQFLPQRGLFRPNSCLLGPAQRCELLPNTGLYRPRSSLTPAHWGPVHASRGLSRPNPCLWAAPLGRASTSQWAFPGTTSCLPVAPSGHAPALWQPLQAQILPHSGLRRPSSCLDGSLSRPSVCCFASSPGPAFPPIGLSGLGSSSWLPLHSKVALKSAFPVSAPASQWPLQAQVILKTATHGPALATLQPFQVHNYLLNLFGLSSHPAPGSLCRLKTSSRQALQAHLLPPGGLHRSSSGWRTASAGPALASQGPLQAQLLPHSCFPGPGSCLPVSRQPYHVHLLLHHVLFRPMSCLSQPAQRCEVLPHTGLSGPTSSLTLACWGPAHAFRGLSRPRPCLWAASPFPASTSQWALSGPASCLTMAPSSQASALQQALQAQLLPPSGLIGQAHASTAAFPGLAIPALHPLQAQHFLQLGSPGPALPPSSLCRPRLPSSRPLQCQLLPPRFLCRPKSYSSRPHPSQLLPLGGLSKPRNSSSCPLQTLLQPPGVHSRPSSSSRLCLQALHFLQLASPGPALPPGGLCRPKLPSSWPHPGPALTSWWPLKAHNFLRSASPGPVPQASQWPL